MPKAEPARSFGIGISTVKHYVGKAQRRGFGSEGTPGKRRKPHEGAMRLLESDLKGRPRRLPLARGAGFNIIANRYKGKRKSRGCYAPAPLTQIGLLSRFS
jgi:hypothetical protein